MRQFPVLVILPLVLIFALCCALMLWNGMAEEQQRAQAGLQAAAERFTRGLALMTEPVASMQHNLTELVLSPPRFSVNSGKQRATAPAAAT